MTKAFGRVQDVAVLSILCAGLVTSLATSTDPGEGPRDELAAELAEAAMEQALQQQISTYHNVSVAVKTNNREVAFSCDSAGTGSYDLIEEGAQLCWESTVESCQFEGNRGGTLILSGTNAMCYASAAAITTDGALGLAEAGELSFSGELTVSGTGPRGNEFAETTCTYDLSGSVTASEEGEFVCTTVDLNGSFNCGGDDRQTGTNAEICVAAEVSVE